MTSATDPHNSGIPVGEVEYLTSSEAAAKLRVGPWQVVELCRTGELPAYKPGKTRKWLIDPADLAAYIASGRNTPADQVSA